MGYRKADPVPDAHGESMALEWAVGEPEPMRSEQYPPFTPKTTPSGDILFTTRTVDPVAAAAEARRSGLWTSTEITDTLWPARDMVVLGNVATGELVNREYRIKTLDNVDLPLSVATDGEGRVWLIVGTDSGFEGLSAFYYSRISYTLSIVEPPNTGGCKPPVWAVVLVAGIGVALAGLGLMAMHLRTRR